MHQLSVFPVESLWGINSKISLRPVWTEACVNALSPETNSCRTVQPVRQSRQDEQKWEWCMCTSVVDRWRAGCVVQRGHDCPNSIMNRGSSTIHHIGTPLSIFQSSNARLGVCLMTLKTSCVVASCGWLRKAWSTTSRKPLSVSMVVQ